MRGFKGITLKIGVFLRAVLGQINIFKPKFSQLLKMITVPCNPQGCQKDINRIKYAKHPPAVCMAHIH